MAFMITVGDTQPSLSTVLEENGAPVDLTEAESVSIEFRHVRGDKVTRAAVVVDAEEGVVRYDFQAGDTDLIGTYLVKWVVEWSAGESRYPSDTYDYFQVTPGV